ncbi:MAG: sigma-70 family RNA polymerase sigma factor [Pseudomonadales bacterium]|nr:sigma-70 family RNA polymerase sigma factor [Pseudomonadales bacterium]
MQEKRLRYENLVNAYNSWLYRYAYWLCGEKATSEDLVQETYLRAWRFLDSLKDEKAAKSWLTTILRRENARRFERKQLAYSEIELDSLPSEREDFDTRPEVLALRNALRLLPKKYREPLVLQVLEGFSLEEIANIFDLPRNTVATRLHRARQKLRKHLNGEEQLVQVNELP